MKDLWKIYRLQAYEKELLSLRARLETLDPAKELRVKKEEVFNELKSKEDKLSKNKKRIKIVTYESDEIDKQMTAVESKLYSGKTKHPKELAQWQREQANLNKKREVLDEENLTLMYENEELEKVVEKISKKYKEIEEEFVSIYSVYEEDLNILKEKINDIENKKTTIIDSLDKETLDIFEDFKSRYGGIAIVPLQRNICGGCGMTLSGMLVERAKSRMSLQCCDHCGRILYWEGGGQSGNV